MDRLGVAPVAYEEDFVRWIAHQVSLLRTAQFEQLDIDHLVEELEGMAGRDRRELGSRLQVVTTHLLKCQFQPRRKSRSWLSTLNTQRGEIEALLRDSPSLVPAIAELARQRYRRAVRQASFETRLPESAFPTALPYSAEELLDDDFVP